MMRPSIVSATVASSQMFMPDKARFCCVIDATQWQFDETESRRWDC
jgi:hypothetical protein